MVTVKLKVFNKVIETRFIKDTHLQIEGYLEGLKRDMVENNQEVMDVKEATFEVSIHAFPKTSWFPLGYNLTLAP